MKRKIQHDAINNQEDEDSSAYPIYFLSNETPSKKRKEFVRNIQILFIDKESKNKGDLEFRHKKIY